MERHAVHEDDIKDTLQTVEIYEHARLEYDAHRHELAVLQQNADAPNARALKQRYESLKEDVRVKLALLDENRLKVMKAQLAQFEKGLHQSFAESIKSLHQSSPTAQDDGDEGNFVRGVAHGPSSFLEH
ncbi:AH domain-containing protein [Aphelenchoides fujianensis]|nr:AH domain-containing protein [Aphelenchoides fujianensis]